MSITIKDIQQYILTQATPEELSSIVQCYKVRNKNLGVMIGMSFSPGDAVTFTGKYGEQIKATFIKQSQKNAKVRAENGVLWTVAPQLLKKG